MSIDISRTVKRARGLIVIECVDEAESLIEEFLSFRGRGGNGMMEIAEARHNRNRVQGLAGDNQRCETKHDGGDVLHRNLQGSREEPEYCGGRRG
jgi:hypothetical protein